MYIFVGWENRTISDTHWVCNLVFLIASQDGKRTPEGGQHACGFTKLVLSGIMLFNSAFMVLFCRGQSLQQILANTFFSLNVIVVLEKGNYLIWSLFFVPYTKQTLSFSWLNRSHFKVELNWLMLALKVWNTKCVQPFFLSSIKYTYFVFGFKILFFYF